MGRLGPARWLPGLFFGLPGTEMGAGGGGSLDWGVEGATVYCPGSRFMILNVFLPPPLPLEDRFWLCLLVHVGPPSGPWRQVPGLTDHGRGDRILFSGMATTLHRQLFILHRIILHHTVPPVC